MRQESHSSNSFILNKQNDADETIVKLVSGNSTMPKDIQLSAIDMQSGQPLPMTINGEQRSRHILQPVETIQIQISNINSQGKIKVGLSQTSSSGGISISQKNTNGINQSVITLK
jgi:poly-gamma-glutamate capsule biosynthesis protein CapA/YwtB (metallophosphatase superfamily)